MPDLYSTDVLIGVVNSLKATPQFLLDRYFGSVTQDDTEEVHFDVLSRTRRVAPFVSPLVEGQIVEGEGFTTKTFKPAYVKPKNRVDPSRGVKRTPGEPIGGNLTPEARLARIVRAQLLDHVDQINRRLEVMAAEALVSATVTVSGEKYPTTVVDYGRAAGHSVTLTTTAWDQAGSKPLDDLQDWALLGLQAEGAVLPDVIMSVDAWKVFREHEDVKSRLDTRYVTENAARLGAMMTEGGSYMGTIDGFNIFVYAGWYINDAGSEVPIFPDSTVVLTGPGLEGVRAFGAILDHDSLRAVPYFPKSWLEQDPSLRYLMTQSAPLVVPTRPNASVAATVL